MNRKCGTDFQVKTVKSLVAFFFFLKMLPKEFNRISLKSSEILVCPEFAIFLLENQVF